MDGLGMMAQMEDLAVLDGVGLMGVGMLLPTLM